MADAAFLRRFRLQAGFSGELSFGFLGEMNWAPSSWPPAGVLSHCGAALLGHRVLWDSGCGFHVESVWSAGKGVLSTTRAVPPTSSWAEVDSTEVHQDLALNSGASHRSQG